MSIRLPIYQERVNQMRLQAPNYVTPQISGFRDQTPGIRKLGEAIRFAYEPEAKAANKARVDSIVQGARDRLEDLVYGSGDGDRGLMGRSGMNAVEGSKEYATQSEAIRKEAKKLLNNDLQGLMFDSLWAQMDRGYKSRLTKHEHQQIGIFKDDLLKKKILGNEADLARDPNSQSTREKYFANNEANALQGIINRGLVSPEQEEVLQEKIIELETGQPMEEKRRIQYAHFLGSDNGKLVLAALNELNNQGYRTIGNQLVRMGQTEKLGQLIRDHGSEMDPKTLEFYRKIHGDFSSVDTAQKIADSIFDPVVMKNKDGSTTSYPNPELFRGGKVGGEEKTIGDWQAEFHQKIKNTKSEGKKKIHQMTLEFIVNRLRENEAERSRAITQDNEIIAVEIAKRKNRVTGIVSDKEWAIIAGLTSGMDVTLAKIQKLKDENDGRSASRETRAWVARLPETLEKAYQLSEPQRSQKLQEIRSEIDLINPEMFGFQYQSAISTWRRITKVRDSAIYKNLDRNEVFLQWKEFYFGEQAGDKYQHVTELRNKVHKNEFNRFFNRYGEELYDFQTAKKLQKVGRDDQVKIIQNLAKPIMRDRFLYFFKQTVSPYKVNAQNYKDYKVDKRYINDWKQYTTALKNSGIGSDWTEDQLEEAYFLWTYNQRAFQKVYADAIEKAKANRRR